MPNPSFVRVKEVFDEWAMYDAVIQSDYMHHAELAAALADWARKHNTPLRIADIGCGDGWLAAQAFRDANVEQYRGVDVSDSAVSRARERVAIWPGRAEVVAGNLAEFLGCQPDGSANVLLASYSIHHFLSDAKIALIADCLRVLVPGSAFFWIDAVLDEDGSRDTYVSRLTNIIQRDWKALSADQRTRVCTHVRDSDFPETADWMREHVQAAGFRLVDTILQGEFFAGWQFARE
jgi:ubiquinone/menaquinone biosynthesis C-methylase UbiE